MRGAFHSIPYQIICSSIHPFNTIADHLLLHSSIPFNTIAYHLLQHPSIPFHTIADHPLEVTSQWKHSSHDMHPTRHSTKTQRSSSIAWTLGHTVNNIWYKIRWTRTISGKSFKFEYLFIFIQYSLFKS